MPESPSTGLPNLVIDTIAASLVDKLADHGSGHCMRIDSVRSEDAQALVVALRKALPGGSADVYVLVDLPAEADGETSIPAERAVELRNRKERQLVLMVPVGMGSTASSLDNSFERVDIATLLREAGDALTSELTDEDLQSGVRRVARELGRTRPVEAWARYVAAVVSDPRWTTVGRMLWVVGLIPDLGGDALVERLARNSSCVKVISRPLRAVSSVADRLSVAGLQDGDTRERIMRYLSHPDVDLSDPAAWASVLLEEPHAGRLTFEHWPLVEQRTVEVTTVRVDPFLKEDGNLRTGTRLRQDATGDLPYAETGDGKPASVTVSWKTDPAKTDAIHRWLLEALPPEDLRGPDTEPVAKQTVQGSYRRTTVRIELAEEDLGEVSLLAIRLSALDATGQPVKLSDGTEAVDESQQFAIRWEEVIVSGSGRRASTSSLAQARLDAALDGQNEVTGDAPSWDEATSAFSLRLGGRRTVLLGLSPALTVLQRKLFDEAGGVTAWKARGRLGDVLTPDDIEPVVGSLPPALADRRKRLLSRLRERHPRDVVETLEWDDELRQEVGGYCQSYRRALDAATDDVSRRAMLTMETVTLSIATAGHAPIAAVIVLPVHPIRLAWLAEYDATLTRWAQELCGDGRSKAQRRQSVDAVLVRRVTPANLPFVVLGLEGSPFAYLREATLGTGIYLDPGEAEPGAAIQAVFDVLGLDRRDVEPDVPPSSLAERITAYRVVHPGQDAMRLLAFNPGSGDLLARALTSSILVPAREDDDDMALPAARLEIVAYSRRPSFTDPLPALTDLQREVAARQLKGARSYLKPPLGLSMRPHNRLAADTSAAHLSTVADLAVVRAGSETAVPDIATSFRNLLTPATNQRVAGDEGVEWQTTPAVRARGREGAVDAVDAHRAYQAALATALGYDARSISLTASLGLDELDALRSAHERADWVITLDRNLGIDLYTEAPAGLDSERPYVLDYAPDFLEGLGPRLTVTTTHRGEVERLLADAMTELDLAAVAESVRDLLSHLQVVSGRLALRLVGRSSLATEAVSLAALMAYLRHRGELDGTIVVPVDAHQEVFGDSGAEAGVRRCDVILVRTTTRTLRMECVEVKSRRAAALPTVLVDDIVDQLESTVTMLRETFFRVDPPRIDAELQRARLVGILRHHANRALAMDLLDERRRSEAERIFEKVEDGTLVPEIGKRGYVVSLGGKAGLPREHRGVRIDVLTAADLSSIGFATSVRTTASEGDGPDLSDDDAGSTSARRPSPTTGPTPDPGTRPDQPGTEPIPGEADGSASLPCVEGDGGQHSGAPTNVPGAAGSWPSGSRIVDVHLGQDAHAADVRWRISTSGSPHMFVLGIPGQGKSVTTRRILNSFADQGLPALVVDFHGDMAAALAGDVAVLDASQGLEISPFELRDDDHTRYPQAAWELSEVIGYVCGLGEIQRNVVYEGVRELYRRHGFGSPDGPVDLPTMGELADAVATLEGAGRGRNVAARLRPLSDFGLFVESGGDQGFAELLHAGVVLDVHGLMEQVQLAAGAFILRKVYREMFQWGQTEELRLAVVLDEAHRLARDVTLPKIMKEGRKYGIAVVVASQGIDDFHRDVLSNAGTKVAFRCNYPQSKTVAGFLRGRAGQDMSVALENLDVGQAYVSTPEQAEARKVLMARD
ncbi:MAG: helicase HerA domain-containing protein [Pseudonocardiaceae bacterium]